MTFSDAKVAERVNARFVPVWFNRGRGFHNCERRTERWIYESAGEAYPTKNICTFFLTPDLEVVYYAAGYYAPALFLEILEAAEALKDARGSEFAARQRRFSSGLADRLEAGVREKVDVPRYRELQHRHGRGCGHALEEALRHRRAVHDALAESGPVPLEKIQHAYLYGNPFSEERRGPDLPTGAFPRPRTATPR